ncbi:MAG: hypothetical protein AAF411_06460 [Myxococcota bacterium]
MALRMFQALCLASFALVGCGDDSSGGGTDVGVDVDPLACTDGDPCDLDGDGCTREVCRDGVCVESDPVDCDDGDSCTIDRCVSTSSATFECRNESSDRSCLIEGMCFADGSANPDNACELCDVGANMSDWSASVASCDDGDACTLDDVCTDGVCAGTPVSDSNEPNDTPDEAITLPEISDSSDFPQSNERGLIFPVEDVDFYRFSVRDTTFGFVGPRVELTGVPEDADYELCGFITCLEDTTDNVSCPTGSPARFEGMQGCCSDEPGNADEAIDIDPSCDGFDDSVAVLVRVRSSGDDVACEGEYTVNFGDD